MKKYRSIAITFSRAMITETGKGDYVHGYRRTIEEIESCTGEPYFFWMRMSNIPVESQRKNITHVYIVIENKVRFRARIFEFRKGHGEMTFNNGKRLSGKYWALLYDFEPVPERPHMKGFQGFRYYQEL